MSTAILSIVSVLQKINYNYIYIALIVYVALIWITTIVWVFNDTKNRYNSVFWRYLTVIFVSITFLFGVLIYLLIRPVQKDDGDYEMERAYLRYETYGMGKCHNCSFDLRPEFIFCPSCAVAIKERCNKCKEYNYIAWDNCPYCSTSRLRKPSIMKKDLEIKEPNITGFRKYYEKFKTFSLSARKLFLKEDNIKSTLSKEKTHKVRKSIVEKDKIEKGWKKFIDLIYQEEANKN